MRFRPSIRWLLILVAVTAIALAVAAPYLNKPRPLAIVIGTTTFASPPIPPGEYRRYSWIIRNDGQAPLILVAAGISPGCGLSLWDGENRVVPPGGKTEVQFSWPAPGVENMPYNVSATIDTNDEKSPQLRLQVYSRSGPRDSIATPTDPEPVRIGP